MMTQTKRLKFHLLPLKGGGWRLTRAQGSPRTMGVFKHSSGFNRKLAVTYSALAASELQPSQLFIHGLDGRVIEERTYPRSSDPRRTKG